MHHPRDIDTGMLLVLLTHKTRSGPRQRIHKLKSPTWQIGYSGEEVVQTFKFDESLIDLKCGSK